MSASTNDSGTNEEECDMTYDPKIENAKYFIQLLYIAPGVLLNIRILIIMLFRHRKIYMVQSFFVIYSLDLIVSSTQLIIDLFIQRPTIYIPQFCPLLFNVFKAHALFTNTYYSIYHYMRAAKPIIQAFLCLNRMTCVLAPFDYSQIWLRFIPITIGVIVLSPFLVVWNVILSETYPITIFGGFTLAYSRKIGWAKLSLFQVAMVMFSLAIIIPTTSITLFKMRALEIRLKSSERSLCLASFCTSIAFFIAAVFQSYFAFFNTDIAYEDLFYFLQAFSFDVVNVGSPMVMILLSGQLRYHVFPCQRLAQPGSTVVSVSSVSRKMQNE